MVPGRYWRRAIPSVADRAARAKGKLAAGRIMAEEIIEQIFSKSEKVMRAVRQLTLAHFDTKTLGE